MSRKTTGAVPVAVLVSGQGSNLQAILAHISDGRLAARVCMVVSDTPDAPALTRARAAAIPVQVVIPADFRNREAWTMALTEALRTSGAKLVVLAGFMRIIGPSLLEAFPGRVLNIHPSLLPLYRGLDTYRRALANGDREHGTSVHFVTPELDGGPVIAQVRVAIDGGDTEATLRQRVQQQEHWLYPRVIGWFVSGRLAMQEGGARLDGKKLAEPLTLPALEAIAPGVDFA